MLEQATNDRNGTMLLLSFAEENWQSMLLFFVDGSFRKRIGLRCRWKWTMIDAVTLLTELAVVDGSKANRTAVERCCCYFIFGSELNDNDVITVVVGSGCYFVVGGELTERCCYFRCQKRLLLRCRKRTDGWLLFHCRKRTVLLLRCRKQSNVVVVVSLSKTNWFSKLVDWGNRLVFSSAFGSDDVDNYFGSMRTGWIKFIVYEYVEVIDKIINH